MSIYLSEGVSMHITLEADYAVRIVGCLAENNKRMDAKLISEQTEVTLRFSLKILRKLVSGGIVKSFKGTQGGYELDKAPNEITLYDVITIVEGPFAISRCLHDDFVCSRNNGKDCTTQRIYDEISTLVREKMEKATFDKLILPYEG